MVEGVTTWLKERLFDVLNGVISKVKGVSDAFFRLYDAVVGNSYVPDMVEGVAAWMAKLDAGMVAPARNATDATKQVFEQLRDDVANIMEGLLTDSEWAARELALTVEKIRKAEAGGLLSPAQARQVEAGVAGAGLSIGPVRQLMPLAEAIDFQASVTNGVKSSQKAFDDAAARFGDEFAYNMERVLRGDIKGAFLDMLSDSLRASLSSVGAGLFKSMNSGQGFSWANVGSSIANFLKIPGFATGGSFKVGGSGGIDSKLVQFRATPGEMVDVRRPGQMPEASGMRVEVVPNPYFDVHVQRVTAPGMVQTGQVAARAGSGMAQSELAKRSRYRTR